MWTNNCGTCNVSCLNFKNAAANFLLALLAKNLDITLENGWLIVRDPHVHFLTLYEIISGKLILAMIMTSLLFLSCSDYLKLRAVAGLWTSVFRFWLAPRLTCHLFNLCSFWSAAAVASTCPLKENRQVLTPDCYKSVGALLQIV